MKKIWLVGLGVISLTAGVALAATLDDFKEAVKHEGCLSIPYDDLRNQCTTHQSEKDDWCTKRGEFRCDAFDPRGLQQQIDNLSGKLKELKEKRDSATDDDARKEINDQIEKLQAKLDEMQKRLDDEKHEIDNRIYVGQNCLDARIAVQETFKGARSRASDESDDQIKPLAEQLIKHWDDGAAAHADPIKNAQTAVNKCRSFK